MTAAWPIIPLNDRSELIFVWDRGLLVIARSAATKQSRAASTEHAALHCFPPFSRGSQ
jgi:hypothetical protein